MARALQALFLILLTTSAKAQGYAGLSAEAAAYAPVTPGHTLTFPGDHQPHPDFRIEWWYITANMEDEAGQPLGLQWTLFRQALQPQGPEEGWESRQLWMGHAAVTTATEHHISETFARGGIGQAGVAANPFRAHIDDWKMTSETNDLDAVTLSASGTDFAYNVQLTATGPLVLQGVEGYSKKSEQGQASYYYSQPHYTLAGTVTLGNETKTVTGTAWLDREWSSQPLSPDQTGWDWFSLHFDDDTKLMAYRLKGAGSYTTGAWIEADGTATLLPNDAMQFEPLEISEVKGREIPTTWRLKWPEKSLDITVEALNAQAYMTTVFEYWEGPVKVTGSHKGLGYLEMTGY
ncbi:MAG: lipocalin-like domain-containing protein [Pseudomonadota bacterium]